jgi:hypothetical protein
VEHEYGYEVRRLRQQNPATHARIGQTNCKPFRRFDHKSSMYPASRTIWAAFGCVPQIHLPQLIKSRSLTLLTGSQIRRASDGIRAPLHFHCPFLAADLPIRFIVNR